MNSLTQQVKEFAKSIGADIVGIATVDRWDKAPRKLSPGAHLPGAKSVVVMGIHHPDASVEWGGLPSSNYAGPFQIGMIPKLDTMSRRMAMFLEKSGAKAVPYSCTGFWRHRPYKDIKSTNTASFSHRHAAVAAGMGEFGLNNMFMSKEFGPRQRLISVITTAELEGDDLYDGPKLCDKCKMCAKNCPGNNFADENLLEPGTDKVYIGNKTYEYAKLNRWRCLWGEQFAFDMSKLKDFDIKCEEDLYRADEEGIPRLGGEMGSCFRYCMGKPTRYWDKSYSTAPRRKKEKKEISIEEITANVIALAKKNGVEKFDIRPLEEFKKEDMKLSEEYPVDDMKKNFSLVISMGRRIPKFTKGIAALEDNEDYIKAVTKVRLSVAAYDIAAYLDNLGYEAMQDWMSLGDSIEEFFKDKIEEIFTYELSDGEVSLPRQVRYKLAASEKVGVQREQQSMTAGQQGQSDKQDSSATVITCSVICNVPLKTMNEKFAISGSNESMESFKNLEFMDQVERVGVVSVDKLQNMPDIMKMKKVLPNAKSVIVLMTGIPRHVAELANNQEAECAVSYSYLQYQTLRELLWAAHDLSNWFGEKGYKSLPIADASMTSFRTAAPYWEFSWAKLGHPDTRANSPLAAAAGLGEIGKSGLLLTPGFGPHQKFVFIVTEAEIEETPIYKGEKLCIDCGKCAEVCPVKALYKDKINKISTANDTSFDVYQRHEDKCQWARSLGMVGAEGGETIGWIKEELPVPDIITDEYAQEVLNKKDPLQVRGYLYQCQIETIIEPCAQVCPAGK